MFESVRTRLCSADIAALLPVPSIDREPLFAQHVFAYPLRGCARQIVNDPHVTWHHKTRHVLPAMRDELVRHQSHIWLQRNAEHHVVVAHSRRDRNDRGLQHGGMLVDRRFYLERADVLSPAPECVLLAVDECEVAIVELYVRSAEWDSSARTFVTWMLDSW